MDQVEEKIQVDAYIGWKEALLEIGKGVRYQEDA